MKAQKFPQKYIVTVDKDRTTWRNEAGQSHRLNGPAHEYADGRYSYYVDGVHGREDGPSRFFPGKGGKPGCEEFTFKGHSYRSLAELKAAVDKMNAPPVVSLVGKVVEIDGKKYKLAAV